MLEASLLNRQLSYGRLNQVITPFQIVRHRRLRLLVVMKDKVLFRLFLTLLAFVFMCFMLSEYVYRIFFVFYYSSSYAYAVVTWTVVGCILGFVFSFRDRLKFKIAMFFNIPVLLISLVKILVNTFTILVFSTRQDSYYYYISISFVLSYCIFIYAVNELNLINSKNTVGSAPAEK